MTIKIIKGDIDHRIYIIELVKKSKGFIYIDKRYVVYNLFKDLYKIGPKILTGIRKDI